MILSQLRKNRIVLLLIAGVCYSFFDAFSFSTGASDPASGLPPNGTCSKCHSGATNAGPGRIAINAPTSYIAGQTYPIEITVTQSGMPKFGFQATAVNSQNQFVGKFDTTGSAGKCQLVFNDISLITHTRQSHTLNSVGSATYRFMWKAPNWGTGSVKFYVAAIASNNDFLMTDDSVMATTHSIAETVVGISDRSFQSKVYPTINDGNFLVEFDEVGLTELSVFDVNGKKQAAAFFTKEISIKLPEHCKNGVYFLLLKNGNRESIQKIIVLK